MKELDRPLAHVTYRDGQLLRACDLRDDRDREARLWRLHNLHLHESWGIAVGFEPTLPSGRTSVRVGPGHALDADGRDLLLDGVVRLALPKTAHRRRFILTARHRGVTRPPLRNDAPGVCTSGRPPRPQRPLLAWRTVDAVRPGEDVLIVGVTAVHGRAKGPLDVGLRRYVRSLRRTRIACGSTEPHHGGWRVWSAPPDRTLGVAITVSTEGAGFSTVPAYFAQLNTDVRTVPAGTIGCIVKATATSFIYRVVHHPEFGVQVGAEKAEEHGWSVSWTGIERAIEVTAKVAP